MRLALAQKVAIITGAGSGIGRASAILFAHEGAKVILADINAVAGEETRKIISERGGEAVFVQTDVSQADEVNRMIQTAVKHFGKLDILFNNAGIAQKNKPFELIQEEEWERVFSVNVKSIFLGAKYAVPELKKNGSGVIINTASISGVRVRPGLACYSTSKGAAIILTKALAIELAPYKIRVNCINPAATDTPMCPELLPEDSVEMKQSLISTIPFGHLAKPEEIANAALFLASDEASFITGIALGVDGGRGI